MISLFLDRSACRSYGLVAYKKKRNDVWRKPPSGDQLCMRIQCGSRFGVLLIQISCTCGTIDNFTYFFHRTEYDAVLSRLFPGTDSSGRYVEIMLPNGYWGIFQRHEGVWGFDDDYILDILVCSFASSFDTSTTCTTMYRYMNSFFDVLSHQIRMRTMFKKWYFRAYRKSFAPGKPGIMRDYLSYTCSTLCEEREAL